MADEADSPTGASYVLAATVRIVPPSRDVHVEPSTFETTVFRDAAPPGDPGWRFFRDECWHGELNHPDHVRALLADDLGVAVDSVAFRELRTTPEYLAALRAAIAEDLGAFNAEDVDEVLHKYLGSSVHVVDPEDH